MRLPWSRTEAGPAGTLRLAGWNALLLMAGLALVALAGEAWLRLTTPFVGLPFPVRFVPDVGIIGTPDTEVRHTNGLDFWTISRTNRLGFLDREPIDPQRAAASCHVAMIGDSFVEAMEVAIADKLHVRLEEMAARELPHLDVTTSAFGRSTTGQVHQLPTYDEYARHLHPRLLVLVVHANDFMDNSTLLYALYHGVDPERMPFASAARDEAGEIGLRPPHPDYMASGSGPSGPGQAAGRTAGAGPPESAARTLRGWLKGKWLKVRGTSLFADWLYAKARGPFGLRLDTGRAERPARAASLRRHPRYAPLLEGWRPSLEERDSRRIFDDQVSAGEGLLPVFRDALDMTAFALDQFKARADRDGAALAILKTYALGGRKTPWGGLSGWLNAAAEARGIPVIGQYDYILRRGGRIEDARWPHDAHWSPTGHRWAAEALLEYLKQHPETCGLPMRATGP